MRGPELLKQHTDIVKSSMGGFIPGIRAIFRGKNLHTDLKDIDWVDLYIFGITGRRFTEPQLRLLHAMWSYTSFPDARLWNNRVAALAGSARSTGNLGISSAMAVSEATIYGRGVDIRAIDFLKRTLAEVSDGGTIADCVKKELELFRGIAGYGRPLTSADERVAPMKDLARTLGLDKGPHLKLAYEIEGYLLAGRWRMRLNAAALWAALGADMGLNPREYYRFLFPAFLAGMQPCLIEAAEKPEGAFLPLSCAHIAYEGIGKRSWR